MSAVAGNNGEKYTIGVDLGGTKIEAATVDASGRIRARIRTETDVDGGADAVEAQIIDVIGQVWEKKERGDPAGVGIGVAGQVDRSSGTVRFSPNLNWHDVPLGEHLRARLGLPVVVLNDVTAATWGEWLHGAGCGCDDLVCLFIGTGIGGGAVIGGRMLTGSENAAGEFGHIPIQLDGPRCGCGNHGCLEVMASGTAIGRRAREAVAADPAAGRPLVGSAGGNAEDITARTVADLAHTGDPLAARIVKEAGAALGVGAVALVNALNPRRLILGGGVIEGFPELVQMVNAIVQQGAFGTMAEHLHVCKSALGQDSGVIGASAFASRDNRE